MENDLVMKNHELNLQLRNAKHEIKKGVVYYERLQQCRKENETLKHELYMANKQITKLKRDRSQYKCKYRTSEKERKHLQEKILKMQKKNDQSIKILKTKINMDNQKIQELYEDINKIKSKYDRLLKQTRELLQNWDEYSYINLYHKLRDMENTLGMPFETKFMLIGSLSRRSERIMEDIKSIISRSKYHRRNNSMSDIISIMEEIGCFGNQCFENATRCKGDCGMPECGAQMQSWFYLWKRQRNIMIHRQHELEWKDPSSIDFFMSKIEDYVTKLKKSSYWVNKVYD